MREIKFRGRSILSNQFVYGHLLEMYHKTSDSLMLLPYIIGSLPESPLIYVKRETIGQFTGLADKNGVEIYEGNICLCDVNSIDYITIVYFKHGTYYLQDNIKEGNLSLSWFIDNNKKIEVIGNIHDNPELLTKIGRK